MVKWCFTSFSSGGLWCALCGVVCQAGESASQTEVTAKDWEELVLQGDQHWDVQLGHGK